MASRASPCSSTSRYIIGLRDTLTGCALPSTWLRRSTPAYTLYSYTMILSTMLLAGSLRPTSYVLDLPCHWEVHTLLVIWRYCPSSWYHDYSMLSYAHEVHSPRDTAGKLLVQRLHTIHMLCICGGLLVLLLQVLRGLCALYTMYITSTSYTTPCKHRGYPVSPAHGLAHHLVEGQVVV